MKRLCSLLIAVSMVLILFPSAVNGVSEIEQRTAEILFSLGLFNGTDAEAAAAGTPVFDLERPPSRLEALILFIRLLGMEEAALGSEYTIPFTDVPDYGLPYVGYAYENGLTRGMNETEFGSSDIASASQYLTFLLRALAYKDGVDFEWDTSVELSEQILLTNPSEYSRDSALTRGQAAVLSFSALAMTNKDTGRPLYELLIENGVFSEEDALRAGLIAENPQNPQSTDPSAAPSPAPVQSASPAPAQTLSAVQIAEKCSPAVFYIEVYDAAGVPIGSGSGFFIKADGLALTNYHVINGAHSARIKTADGNWYNVTGALSVNEVYDVALIKTEGSNFATLTAGDSSKVKQGETIYTIGSPMGLDNTLSNGIISNTSRSFDDGSGADPTRYIQFTASISSGNSGGALINEYGEVIGITTAVYTVRNGTDAVSQSLNLAVPIKTAFEQVSETGDIKTLASLFPVTEQIIYLADFPDVPDVGEMQGIAPVYESGKSYSYEYSAHTADYIYYAGDSESADIMRNKFARILANDGYSYLGADARLDMEVYSKTAPNGLEALVGIYTDVLDGVYYVIYLVMHD